MQVQRFEVLTAGEVWSILRDREHTMWLGTLDGLFKIEDGRWRRYSTDDGLASNRMRSIMLDAEGVLWIGTTTGVTTYDKGIFTSHTFGPGAKSLFDVSTMTVDREGSIWVGSRTDGLAACGAAIKSYGTGDGLAAEYVAPSSDSQGTLDRHECRHRRSGKGASGRWPDQRPVADGISSMVEISSTIYGCCEGGS